MPSLLSQEFLFALRNHIPVIDVITKTLNLPWKISENYFRFLCPGCQEFRTAVNKKTNLARCFLCEKNYNSIDLVIAVRNVKFLEAVDILKPLLSR